MKRIKPKQTPEAQAIINKMTGQQIKLWRDFGYPAFTVLPDPSMPNGLLLLFTPEPGVLG